MGFSVALSPDGNTAITGGPAHNVNMGAVWPYARIAGAWAQQGSRLFDANAPGGQLGASVSLSADGNRAIVGSPGDGGGIGAASIFTRSGGVWTPQAGKLIASEAGLARQGISVSLSADGSTATVGGPAADGAAWVFAATATPPPPTTPLTMTGPLPAATVGLPYSQTLTAAGGAAPLVWSVDANTALPSGLTLSPTSGVLSGTPTTAGAFSFTVLVRDAAQQMAARSLSLTVVAAAASVPLEITSPLPPARAGVPYNQAIFATGGTAPYAWSVVNGALPAGIQLSPSGGVLAGTPTVRGNTMFTLMLTDQAARTVTGRFLLAVE